MVIQLHKPMLLNVLITNIQLDCWLNDTQWIYSFKSDFLFFEQDYNKSTNLMNHHPSKQTLYNDGK
jgi:hypothetical protein